MRGEGVSRDHSRTRACSRKRTVRSSKGKGNLDNFVILDADDDDDDDDVIIIDVPQSLHQKLKSSTVLKDGKQIPCVICIDDDDDGSDNDRLHNVEGSGRRDASNDTSTRRSPTFCATPKTVDEDAGDLGILKKKYGFKLSKCQKTQSKGSPSRNRFGMSYESEDLSESSSSDCEVLEGFGDLHEQFEEASLKKKSDEDKNKTVVEDQANPCNSPIDVHPDVEVEDKQGFEASASSSFRNIDSDKRDSSCNCIPAKVVLSEKGEQFTHSQNGCNTCSNEEQCKSPYSNEREEEKVVYVNKFVSDHVFPDFVVENVVAPSAKTGSECVPGVSSYEKPREQDIEKIDSGENFTCISSHEERFDEPGTSRSSQESENDHLTPFSEVLPVAVGDFIFEREKLKDTDEYKRADEEEWAERHRQLQIQAEEVQRLRKRKKVESLRILDMEKRLKQRVEEVRETKKKDEENLNIKERLRAEITKELQRLELTCGNLASLLRGLGIRVEGGFSPPSQELHAAYKRALLRFHPDRASRTDIRQQVEAEEKFKLISRMKEKFLSTSSLIY